MRLLCGGCQQRSWSIFLAFSSLPTSSCAALCPLSCMLQQWKTLYGSRIVRRCGALSDTFRNDSRNKRCMRGEPESPTMEHLQILAVAESPRKNCAISNGAFDLSVRLVGCGLQRTHSGRGKPLERLSFDQRASFIGMGASMTWNGGLWIHKRTKIKAMLVHKTTPKPKAALLSKHVIASWEVSPLKLSFGILPGDSFSTARGSSTHLFQCSAKILTERSATQAFAPALPLGSGRKRRTTISCRLDRMTRRTETDTFLTGEQASGPFDHPRPRLSGRPA
mmetsp:Transcript_12016/g.23969  ORF Transcript_12016/g.23969 Transcript_12016/m.23969 type:complete len:279 (-) Transcript_12016:517-1353(-)